MLWLALHDGKEKSETVGGSSCMSPFSLATVFIFRHLSVVKEKRENETNLLSDSEREREEKTE